MIYTTKRFIIISRKRYSMNVMKGFFILLFIDIRRF